VVFNTGLYTVLPDNSILITANMQSKTGFPSSHQLKSYMYVASKSHLKLAARAVLSADAGLLVTYSCRAFRLSHPLVIHITSPLNVLDGVLPKRYLPFQRYDFVAVTLGCKLGPLFTNNNVNVYGAVIIARPLRKFTRFI